MDLTLLPPDIQKLVLLEFFKHSTIDERRAWGQVPRRLLLPEGFSDSLASVFEHRVKKGSSTVYEAWSSSSRLIWCSGNDGLEFMKAEMDSKWAEWLWTNRLATGPRLYPRRLPLDCRDWADVSHVDLSSTVCECESTDTA